MITLTGDNIKRLLLYLPFSFISFIFHLSIDLMPPFHHFFSYYAAKKYVYSNHDTDPTIWMSYFFLKVNLFSNVYQLCKQLEGRAWRRRLTWWWRWRWRWERRKINFRFLDKNEIAEEEEVASDNTNTNTKSQEIESKLFLFESLVEKNLLP